MLDTNVFDRVAKGKLSLQALPDGDLIATHVQLDELSRTSNLDDRQKLLEAFNKISPDMKPTKTAIWGDSRWGQSSWSDGKTYEMLLARLTELDNLVGKKSKDPMNQSRDARIAETAIVNGYTLITGDRNLSDLTAEFGGQVIFISHADLGTQTI